MPNINYSQPDRTHIGKEGNMKKVGYGWVGKEQDWGIISSEHCTVDDVCLFGIYYNRGNKGTWMGYDWPPRKVRIIIEEVE
jgi:hypothetical protein